MNVPHPRPLFMRLTVPAHHMSIRVMTEAWQPRLRARCGPVSSPPASTLSPTSLFAIRQPEELSSSIEQSISCCPCLGTRSTPPSRPTARGPAPVSLQSHLTLSFGQLCAGERSGVCWQLETDHDRSIYTREINKREKSFPPSPRVG